MNFEDYDLADSSQVDNQPLPEIEPIREEEGSVKNRKTIRFQILVNFFNRLMTIRGRKKSDYVKNFVKVLFKNNRHHEFTYSILRLMLPADDRDRGNYGIKQRVLAKIVNESLRLKKDDYQRLRHYKNPSYHQTGVGIGDFALCLHSAIQGLCNIKSQLTVEVLNNLLDQLASVSTVESQVLTFNKLFQISNAQEIKWITRIILKDLKLAIKIQTVLNTLHADGNQYFNLTNSIKEVCKKFENPKITLSDQICIFHPIRPMLAGKKRMKFFNNIDRLYYVETKYDGERIQAHIDSENVKLFSRNAVDYTQVYEELIPLIRNSIEADACILDGEMIVLESNSLNMMPFGLNKIVALNKQADLQLCYKIFDILWVKKETEEVNMMGYPLKERKNLLHKVVKEERGRIEIVPYKQLHKYDDILMEFDGSIQRNEQGLMLKDPETLYLPKDRGNSWLKLKGDYEEGLTDTLDLIIIGGYFGDLSYRIGTGSHWTDRVTCFLLGLIRSIDPNNQKIAYAVPFCKIGTGYSGQQLSILRQRLKNNLILNDGRSKPNCFIDSWKPKLQDRPDCFINHLHNSFLLEVKAAEFIESPTFAPGMTLRFPRVVNIRYDKDWSEGMTQQQFKQMRDNQTHTKNMRKRRGQSDEDDDINGKQDDIITKKRKYDIPKKTKDQILNQYVCADIKNEKIKSHLFQQMEFTVLNIENGPYRKHQIQREILLNGGQVAQNPLPTTKYIISEKYDFKLRLLENIEKFTFIKPKYTFNCVKAQRILPLSPIYLTILPKKQIKFYNQNFDRFGDSYSAYLDRRQLDEILAQMKNKKYPIDQNLIKKIQRKRNKIMNQQICICFGLSKLNIIKLKFRGYKVVNSFSCKPQYVIVEGTLSPQAENDIKKYLKRNPQVQSWNIEDMIQNQQV